ncbi:MAG TPA: hypothetical protein VFN31_00575 [Candidatus Saccharimonadales bacterium]|nr:hypothetical protein [Candidatus Saccharimonadales bacterium]
MFTTAFASKVISPVASRQPGFVQAPIHLGLHIFLINPFLFNLLFVVTQFCIGVLILYKRTAKLGLYLSIGWGLIVWALGEAYGGLFSGHAMLLMGAPGAAILYVFLSMSSLPKESDNQHNAYPAYWLIIVWAIIWVGAGIYQILPGQNTIGDISAVFINNSKQAPQWLSSIDKTSARFVHSFSQSNTIPETARQMNMSSQQMASMTSPPPLKLHSNTGYLIILCLSIAQILVGVAVFISEQIRKVTIWLGIFVSLLFWMIGQNFGYLYSGLATDPNTGPLLVILGLAIMSQTSTSQNMSIAFAKLRKFTVG